MSPAMRFSNQTKDEVLRHLSNLLRDGIVYNLTSDPLRIFLEIRETCMKPSFESKKRTMIRQEYMHFSKRRRRLSSTRKRVGAKIRSYKRGRTVNLKGVVY